ncbi:MAG: ribosome small subunit-dependent GTPase A [Bacilli bacterium]
MKGQIIKIVSNDYFIESNNSEYICKARGKLKKDNIIPKVGDYVIFNKEEKVLEKVLPRKNELDRPNVSNIDEAFIITSLKKPDFSTNLLDKLLVICEINGITPVICLTKKDLLPKNEWSSLKKIIKYYKKLGYPVLYNNNISKIKKRFKNKTIVFTGQTGSGKSTLLNKLDKSLNFETNEISEALGRGKHTTRYVTLVSIAGGKVLDTPGFSAIDLTKYTNEEIRDSFAEFKKYHCSYKNCMHINEKECKVKKQVGEQILKSRYENFLKFIEKR